MSRPHSVFRTPKGCLPVAKSSSNYYARQPDASTAGQPTVAFLGSGSLDAPTGHLHCQRGPRHSLLSQPPGLGHRPSQCRHYLTLCGDSSHCPSLAQLLSSSRPLPSFFVFGPKAQGPPLFPRLRPLDPLATQGGWAAKTFFVVNSVHHEVFYFFLPHPEGGKLIQGAKLVPAGLLLKAAPPCRHD